MESHKTNDREIAVKYAPRFYADSNEPFPIVNIGYKVLTEDSPSPSFDRHLSLPDNADCVIEYAVYFDYDIQHLYDLEHVWVYVGANGEVVHGESSAHGKFLNCFAGAALEDKTHLPLYLEPGKHAMKPDTKAFNPLSPACYEQAGKDGLLVTKLFKGKMHKTDETDRLIQKHIYQFRFRPTMDYKPFPYAEDVIIPMDELLELIPQRVAAIISKLKG